MTDKTTIKALCARLRFLSEAVTKNTVHRHFYMSVPARPCHDADIVLDRAADLIEELEKRGSNECAKE